MNGEIFRATIRHRMTSRLRLALAGLLLAPPLLLVAFGPPVGLQPLGAAVMLTFVFGAGVIGQEVSSGVLQLVFARPVPRRDYLLARWLAVSALAAGLSTVQVTLGISILALRGHPPEFTWVLAHLGEQAFEALGTAAVLTLFSSLVPAFADVALYAGAFLGFGVLQAVSQLLRSEPARRLLEQLAFVTAPRIDLTPLVFGTPLAWTPLAAYGAVVCLSLGLAVVALNRKELSYGSS